jgi:hypothetical protein
MGDGLIILDGIEAAALKVFGGLYGSQERV